MKDSLIMDGSTKSRKQSLDDYVDCMHHNVTAYILGVFALLVASKQYFGNPIDCFISAESNHVRTWQAYILGYCLMQGTYRYDFRSNMSKPFYTRGQVGTKHVTVNYYQWVPVFFAFQLFCFKVPQLFWSYIQTYLYVDMSMIVTESSELNADECTNRRLCRLKNVASYIFNYFYYKKIARRNLMTSVFRLPAVVSVLYGFTKFLYLFNAILQIFLTTYFLGFPDLQWGLKIIFALLNHSYTFSYGVSRSSYGISPFPYFPLEVGCNYTKMESNDNLHTSLIQCIIPLNYINEKLFLFLWFWFIILVIITTVNIMVFVALLISKSYREDKIISLLRTNEQDDSSAKERVLVYRFVHQFMGVDGVLLMRFITAKAGTFICRDLVKQVWLIYQGEQGGVKNKGSDDEWSIPPSENCYSASYYPDDCSARTSLNNTLFPS